MLTTLNDRSWHIAEVHTSILNFRNGRYPDGCINNSDSQEFGQSGRLIFSRNQSANAF
jgi:hypothetical protein